MSKFKRNKLRRILGIMIDLSPMVLAVSSMVYSRNIHPSILSMAFFGASSFIACINFWLAFGRPYFYSIRHGSYKGLRHISGFPFLGTALSVLAVITCYGSVIIAVLAALTLLLDTGGSIWFLYSTWNDSSFWGDPEKSLGEPQDRPS